ncbi:alpha/beta hydrolase [Pseudoxanthomonas winnipegensis]|uniref:alpha/beta hydrolase n=1 Tax=Pseudoxanthomonas winnipegensis TaxID=2480810 RepID=UPI0013F15234|nr:alpha/beta hydrolase [Pseudoxanthomonas winnipegensis]
MKPSRLLRLGLGALSALTLSACQSLAFGIANHGQGQPDATAVYDPVRQLSLDVYRPVAAVHDAPVLVYFYGGSWQHGSRSDYRFVGRRLASTGAVVMIADYRLAPDTVFPGFVEDGARAVAWARAHAADYGANPARIFLAGHSAGAQIAALLGTDAHYLADQGVPRSAIAGVIGLAGPYDFQISGELTEVFGPPSRWPRAQPIGFVDGDEPPFLLVSGRKDTEVEPRQTEDLAERLRAAGGQVEVLWLPGGHLAPLIDLYAPRRHPALLAWIGEFVRAP